MTMREVQTKPESSELPAVSERLMRRAELETLPTQQLTQFQLTWMRFRRHRLAMIGVGILLFMLGMAVLAPIISPEAVSDPCNSTLQVCPDVFNAAEKAPDLSAGLRYALGADSNGHSISAQIIYGARFSLLIGFCSALLATFVGVVIGAVSGYVGGWTDSIVMRVVDVFLSLPILPILLLTASIFGGGHTSVLLVIAIFTCFGWAYIARLVRSLFLSLRAQEFAEAARAVGVSDVRIIFRHLLPNSLRPILVATTLGVAAFIVFESAIDFLGIGLQYPDTSWGSVLAFAQTDPSGIRGAPWVTIFPGLFLVATVVAVNFVGDGLSDALDVRSKPL